MTEEYKTIGIELDDHDVAGYLRDRFNNANRFVLNGFQLLFYRNDRFVLFGCGTQVAHTLSWTGSNYHHGRLPFSPVFNTPIEAIEWLWATWKRGYWQKDDELTGHHRSEQGCIRGCDNRELIEIDYWDLEKIQKTSDIRTVMGKQMETISKRLELVSKYGLPKKSDRKSRRKYGYDKIIELASPQELKNCPFCGTRYIQQIEWDTVKHCSFCKMTTKVEKGNK